MSNKQNELASENVYDFFLTSSLSRKLLMRGFIPEITKLRWNNKVIKLLQGGAKNLMS